MVDVYEHGIVQLNVTLMVLLCEVIGFIETKELVQVSSQIAMILDEKHDEAISSLYSVH